MTADTRTSHIRCSGESSIVVSIKIYKLYIVLAAGNAIVASNAAAAGSSTSAHRDDECNQHDQQASYLHSQFNVQKHLFFPVTKENRINNTDT